MEMENKSIRNFNLEEFYESCTNHFPNHKPRPVIGITGNFGEKGCELGEGYYKSIERAGGIPLVIPPTENAEILLSLLDRIDGLMLSGGADINPLFMGEEPMQSLGFINHKRDRGELLLIKLAYDRQIPILGICRGIQALAIALGGKVYQDLSTCLPEKNIIKHSQNLARGVASHSVEAEEGSTVMKLLGSRFFVNSFHHQAVSEPGPHLKVVARSSDGVIEAVESNELKSIIGVQWHPECFILEDDPCMFPLFQHFISDADSFRKARKVHESVLTLDSHCDTPMFFDQGVQFDHRDPKVLVDLHKMTEGMLDSTIMVAYLEQLGRSPEELKAATKKADKILSEIKQMVNSCNGVEIAYKPSDLYAHKAQGLKSVMLGIENGYAIGRDISNVERYKKMGVTYITLCHNGDNDICDSARRSTNENNGLSDFGRKVVSEMNRVGIMVDLSHGGEKSFYDAVETSKLPIVCSHASSRALCNHPRNLTDDQLRCLAKTGGVAQVTFYHGFLRLEGEATIKDAVRHLMHFIEVAGIDHVGIGTDFDGDGGIRGCACASELPNFTRRLIAEGLNLDDLRKIWGGNFLRVMKQVQDAGEIKL